MTDNKLNVLLLEDSSADAELIVRAVEREGYSVEPLVLERKDDFLRALKNGAWDLIISDYRLPDLTGVDALSYVLDICPKVPFIVVTGSINEEAAVEIMKAGAWDYVLKTSLVRLGPAVRSVLEKSSLIKEEEKAFQETRESKKELQKIIDSVQAVIFHVDLQGGLLRCNRSLLDVLDVEEREVLGSDIYARLFGDRKTDILEIDDQIKRTGKPKTGIECRMRISGGREKWYLMDKSPCFDESGKVSGVVTTAVDITKRKVTEEALREAMNRFETITEKNPLVAIVGVDSSRRMCRWNAAAEAMTGIKAEDVRGRRVEEFIPDQKELKVILDNIDRIVETKAPIEPTERRLMLPSGKELWLYSASFPIMSGDKVVEVLRMDIDITDRKKYEQALSEGEKRYRSIVETAPYAILIVSGGRIEFMNREALETLGGNAFEEFIGKDLGLILGEDARETLSPMLDSENVSHIRKNASFRKKDGKTFMAEISSANIIFKGEKAVQIMFRDVTEKIRSQEVITGLAKFPEEDPDPIIRVDTSGRCMYANIPAMSLPEGLKCVAGQEVPEEMLKWAGACMRTGQVIHEESGSEEQVFAFSVVPLTESGYCNIYGADITELKNTERNLLDSVRELKQFKQVTVGRENRMIELKKEINRLSAELGFEEPYDVSFAE